LELHRGLRAIIAEFQPAEVAVEQLFFSRNVTTAIAVGQARGVALLAAAEAGLPVAEYSPPQVKQAVVGDGRADKERIQEMVRLILRLDRRPEPDDAADGLALAICHANSRNFRERVATAR
jgi:crossover junction endodeoxyribonuclease RuvC